MTNQDELLIELVDSLKTQNENLLRQLDKRPRSILGIVEMWISFWSTIGGMWKDFWTAISPMWSTFWNHDALPIVGGILGFTLIVCSAIVLDHVFVPNEPLPKSTQNYFLTGDNFNKCYRVSQEMSDGSMRVTTPCIKDKDEALKMLGELKEIK